MSAASRPKRAVPSELPSLTLDMFPPGHSRVLTPRTDGTRTWCSVLGHKMERGAPPLIKVHPEGDEDPSYITLEQVRKCIEREGLEFAELFCRISEPSDKKVKVDMKLEVKTEPQTESKANPDTEKATNKLEMQASALSLPEPIRAKFEYFQKSEDAGAAKDEDTLSREALRAKLQTTLAGHPRAVFRAGCHSRCLTQVLGGVGTDDFRRVNEDHILPDGHVLIRKGEFYLWGLADWNPWAPSFAGDSGLYMFWDLASALKETGQKHFHLFRHCTDNKLKMPPSAWHGKDAAKKALYLGMYTVDEDCTQEMRYNDLAPVYTATQDLMCDYELRKGHGSSIQEIRARLERDNPTFSMQVVVPVGYDERLYEELVRFGANNGVVATDINELGRL